MILWLFSVHFYLSSVFQELSVECFSTTVIGEMNDASAVIHVKLEDHDCWALVKFRKRTCAAGQQSAVGLPPS